VGSSSAWFYLPSVVIDIINVQCVAVRKRKTTRQLARTVIAQKPFSSPLSG